MKIHKTAPYESFPDCMHPQDAFPRYNMPHVHKDQIVRLGETYLQSMHIWYIWDRAAEKILAKHKELIAAGHPPNTTVVLDLPCPFLSIMTLTCMEAAQEAATALKFNRTIVQMARTVINGMKQAGVSRYNGAHLRCACRQHLTAARQSDVLGPVQQATHMCSFVHDMQGHEQQ